MENSIIIDDQTLYLSDLFVYEYILERWNKSDFLKTFFLELKRTIIYYF